MFTLHKVNYDSLLLTIELPQGHTMAEINELAKEELAKSETKFHGKHLKITGRCTTALAMLLGHELAHISKSVSLFDSKENTYVPIITH